MYIVYNIFTDNKLFIDNGKKVSKIFVIFDAIIRCNNFLLDTCYISKKDVLSIYEIIFRWNFTISSKNVVKFYKPWYTNSKWYNMHHIMMKNNYESKVNAYFYVIWYYKSYRVLKLNKIDVQLMVLYENILYSLLPLDYQ
jgi:hypothetical protein